ncbi:hypothetical protein Sjap_009158 [Stephania japonica]|uniref:Uncharacterized protein n=1 Tax=Stephania japonica TaxID=461633 RepID=A0AAP0PD20_9MAGN
MPSWPSPTYYPGKWHAKSPKTNRRRLRRTNKHFKAVGTSFHSIGAKLTHQTHYVHIKPLLHSSLSTSTLPPMNVACH